jgi:hypothetical protein
MQRLAKGEVAMRIEVWRQGQKMAEYAKLAEMRDALADPGLEAGLRLLRQIWARMVKGELGLRVVVWYQTMKLQQHRREIAMMRRQPAVMLKMLREVVGESFKRLQAKGQLDLCPELKLAVEREEMRNNALKIGCKMLYRVMLQTLKDLVFSFPLRVWRAKMRDLYGESKIRYV